LQHHIGSSVIWFDETDSTNNLLKDWADADKSKDGMVICARYQTAGRGQNGSKWEGNFNENLALSIMLFPHKIEAIEQVKLNIAVALGVRDYVSSRVKEDVFVKWSNDIFVGDKKISGILIENNLQGEYIRQSIIGIGLNVNQQTFNTEKAVSLSQITEKKYQPEEELSILLEALQKRINSIYLVEKSWLILQYEKVMYRINQRTKFQSGDKIFEGIPLGIDSFGNLKVETNAGVLTFRNKEVVWLE